MDTRRRSDFDSLPRTSELAFEVAGAEAELVELRVSAAVSGSGAWHLPLVAALLILGGIVALAALPSTTRSVAADGEPTASATGATSHPRIWSDPIIAALPSVTAAPDPVGPWVRNVLEDLDRRASVNGVWPVGGGFVAMVGMPGSPDRAAISLFSEDGVTWERPQTAPSNLRVPVGTVAAGRLWLAGETYDRSDEDLWWTEDGQAWHGPASMRALLGGAAVLRSIDVGPGGWLAVVDGARAGDAGLRFSRDGREWEKVRSAPITEGAWIVDLASDESGWIVITEQPTGRPGVNRITALASRDGRAWEEHSIGTLTGTGRDLARGGAGFALVGEERGDGAPHPISWQSIDGRTWTAFRQPSGAGRASASMDLVTPLGDGYVAFNRVTGEAWQSADGRHFESVPALVSSAVESINAVAATSSIIVAAGRGAGCPAIWQAELASLG